MKVAIRFLPGRETRPASTLLPTPTSGGLHLKRSTVLMSTSLKMADRQAFDAAETECSFRSTCISFGAALNPQVESQTAANHVTGNDPAPSSHAP